jgi:hypothetical protein
MQGLDLNLFFFFRKKFRSFDDFEQMSGLWSMFWFKSFRKFFRKIAKFRSLVGNTVDVGWPTIKSGCLPTTERYTYMTIKFRHSEDEGRRLQKTTFDVVFRAEILLQSVELKKE